MILTCPQCATRYQADPSKFAPPGRNVRCAKCGHVWHQAAPATGPDPDIDAILTEPEAAPPPEPAAAPMPSDAPAPAVPFPTMSGAVDRGAYASAPDAGARGPWLGRAALLAGWALLVAAVLTIGWAVTHWKQDIADLWPQTATLFAATGTPVNTRGIDFRNVAYHQESEDGQPVLAVTGEMVNVSGRELPVPRSIRVGLSDSGKREIYHWNFTPEATLLKPGQVAPFVTRLSSPPAAARSLELKFEEP